MGDIAAPPYRDFEHRVGGIRNEAALVDYSRKLGEAVVSAVNDGRFVLLRLQHRAGIGRHWSKGGTSC